ncbi:hypothetical protein ACIQRS_14215 [Streptomyces termitum]|uniref:Uncharacterized protein n=1 Tax=Streptomyces termitum TaxID=67368 RepID=A0A918T9P0_9ACTN|nr:hypothetical protein [Streptomyces termitum]GHB09004.1 hypothetical protein GCM10010305_59900 [Streptomyces termitum]
MSAIAATALDIRHGITTAVIVNAAIVLTGTLTTALYLRTRTPGTAAPSGSSTS